MNCMCVVLHEKTANKINEKIKLKFIENKFNYSFATEDEILISLFFSSFQSNIC